MDRLWSHMKFHAQYMGNWDNVKNYSKAEMIHFIRKFALQEDGHYGTHLARFLEVFDRKNILVLDFNDIKRSPEDLLRNVTRFLEIPELVIPRTIRDAVNASEKMLMPDGLLEEFRSEMLQEMKVLDKLGYDFSGSWKNNLEF